MFITSVSLSRPPCRVSTPTRVIIATTAPVLSRGKLGHRCQAWAETNVGREHLEARITPRPVAPIWNAGPGPSVPLLALFRRLEGARHVAVGVDDFQSGIGHAPAPLPHPPGQDHAIRGQVDRGRGEQDQVAVGRVASSWRSGAMLSSDQKPRPWLAMASSSCSGITSVMGMSGRPGLDDRRMISAATTVIGSTRAARWTGGGFRVAHPARVGGGSVMCQSYLGSDGRDKRRGKAPKAIAPGNAIVDIRAEPRDAIARVT